MVGFRAWGFRPPILDGRRHAARARTHFPGMRDGSPTGARRRCFDHLAAEISVAVGSLVPRYRLWLHLHALGVDPEGLSAKQAAAFCGAPLPGFLAECGLRLAPRRQLRLQRSLRRYDPSVPAPHEHFA